MINSFQSVVGAIGIVLGSVWIIMILFSTLIMSWMDVRQRAKDYNARRKRK
jgi:hypothetical protein